MTASKQEEIKPENKVSTTEKVDTVISKDYKNLLSSFVMTFGDLSAIAKGNGQNSEVVMQDMAEALKRFFKKIIDSGLARISERKIKDQKTGEEAVRYSVDEIGTSKFDVIFKYSQLKDLLTKEDTLNKVRVLAKMLNVPIRIDFKGSTPRQIHSFFMKLPEIKELNPEEVSTFKKGSESGIVIDDYTAETGKKGSKNIEINTKKMEANGENAKYLGEIEKNFSI